MRRETINTFAYTLLSEISCKKSNFEWSFYGIEYYPIHLKLGFVILNLYLKWNSDKISSRKVSLCCQDSLSDICCKSRFFKISFITIDYHPMYSKLGSVILYLYLKCNSDLIPLRKVWWCCQNSMVISHITKSIILIIFRLLL